jgi:hypothetical protein
MKKYIYKKPIINQKKIKLTFFSSMNRINESIIELAQASSNNCIRCSMNINGVPYDHTVCGVRCCSSVTSNINTCN